MKNKFIWYIIHMYLICIYKIHGNRPFVKAEPRNWKEKIKLRVDKETWAWYNSKHRKLLGLIRFANCDTQKKPERRIGLCCTHNGIPGTSIRHGLFLPPVLQLWKRPVVSSVVFTQAAGLLCACRNCSLIPVKWFQKCTKSRLRDSKSRLFADVSQMGSKAIRRDFCVVCRKEIQRWLTHRKA